LKVFGLHLHLQTGLRNYKRITYDRKDM